MSSAKLSARGFTLLELLVVIAIIGVLSVVVLASTNSTRGKSRDARRLADIRQIRNALELYYDVNKVYPSMIGGGTISPLVPGYIPQVPIDPLGNNYQYFGTASVLNGACLSYHLGANLELASNPALLTDADVTPAGTACRGEGISGGVVASNVTSASDIVGTDGASNFYDIKP